MSRLVNNLVVFIRAQRGELKLSPQPARLAELLTSVAEEYQKVAATQGVDLTTSVKNEIMVKVDHERIKQLLENLIENAIAYSPGGGKVDSAWGGARERSLGLRQGSWNRDTTAGCQPYFSTHSSGVRKQPK